MPLTACTQEPRVRGFAPRNVALLELHISLFEFQGKKTTIFWQSRTRSLYGTDGDAFCPFCESGRFADSQDVLFQISSIVHIYYMT